MLDGYTRKPYRRIGGLVTCVPPTQVPLGSAVLAEDVRYTAVSVKTREGLTQVLALPETTDDVDEPDEDEEETLLYFIDKLSLTLRTLSLPDMAITTIAGQGYTFAYTDAIGTLARFSSCSGLWGDGSVLYISTATSIRQYVLATGQVSTIAGHVSTTGLTDGIGLAARFWDATGLWGNATHLYIADLQNQAIRKMALSNFDVTTLCTFDDAGGVAPTGLWGDDTYLYVACGDNTVRRVVLANGSASVLAGTHNVTGQDNGIGAAASFDQSYWVWGDGTNLYIADEGNCVIRKIVISTAEVTTFAGVADDPGSADGIATGRLRVPYAIWGDGTMLYVADVRPNSLIRGVNIATQEITTIAGIVGTNGATDGAFGVGTVDTVSGIWGT